MEYLAYFFNSVIHATPQGYVGVSIIFIYFTVMLAAIAYRIKKGDHMHH